VPNALGGHRATAAGLALPAPGLSRARSIGLGEQQTLSGPCGRPAAHRGRAARSTTNLQLSERVPRG